MIYHICYALNEGYIDYCLVSIASVIVNNPNKRFSFHLLTDEIRIERQQYIKHWFSQWELCDVNFYNVDDSLLLNQKTSWSKYSWYRIFAANVLADDIELILYLDCDVIVNGAIDELWNYDFSNKALAGVPDAMSVYDNLYQRIGYSLKKGYFCAGVLMMNLEMFRKNNLAEKILKYARQNPDRIIFPDQDALNIVCCDDKILYPLKFGILAPFFTDESFISTYKNDIKECLDDPRIIHYAGCNPWIKESDCHFMNKIFWDYTKYIPGGIKKKHSLKGYALLSYTTKKILGHLGISKFKCYKTPKAPSLEEINLKLNKFV